MLKLFVLLLVCLVPLVRAAEGQALPAVTTPASYQGFRLPTVSGTLHYSLTASEVINRGQTATTGGSYGTAITGQLGFLSPSVTQPFSLVYSGGFTAYAGGGNSEPVRTFQNLAASQVFSIKRWTLTANDTFSYLPDSPTSGLSGLPGLGDLGLLPIFGGTGVSTLSPYATRVSNSASTSVRRALTGKQSVVVSGTWRIERYPGLPASSPLGNDTYTGVGAYTLRADARTQFDASYAYSHYGFQSQSGAQVSQQLVAEVERHVTARLKVNLGGGPEVSKSTSSQSEEAKWSYVAKAALNYETHPATYSANYGRATNSGSGLLAGAITDTANGTATRRFTHALSGTANIGYSRSNSLPSLFFPAYSTEGLGGGVQFNRAMTRTLSVYGSYTATNRSNITGTAQKNVAVNGLDHVIGFGLTYTAREIRVGGKR